MGWFFTVVLSIVLVVFICKNGSLNTEISIMKYRISVLKKNGKITVNDEKFLLTGNGEYTQPAENTPAQKTSSAAPTYFDTAVNTAMQAPAQPTPVQPAPVAAETVPTPVVAQTAPPPAAEEFVMKPVAEQPLPKTEVPPATAQPVQSVIAPAEKKSVSTINIILIVGTLFVVLAGLIFATTTWASLTNGLRSFMILMFTLVFFGASAISEKKFGLKSTGIAFYTLGSIFMPITLTAIGFFGLFGEWFSFTGYGKFILLGLISFLLTLFSGLGAVKYKVNILSWISLFGLSATALFTSFFMVGEPNAISAIMMAVFSLIVVFADRFIPDKQDGKLYILFKNWKIYAMYNALALAVVSVFTAGEGVAAFISMVIFCVVFMHARFRNGSEAPVGVIAFMLVFIASMVMLVQPENVTEFTYIAAMTVLAVFILQATNIYSEGISKVLECIGYVVIGISSLMALIGIISDEAWTLSSILLLGIIVINTAYLILKKGRPLRILFAFAVVALSYAAPSYLLADTEISTSIIATSLIAILFAVSFFVKNRMRSHETDAVAFAVLITEYIIRAMNVIDSAMTDYVIFAVVFAAYLLVALPLCTENRKSVAGAIFRGFFLVSTFMLCYPFTEFTGSDYGVILWSAAIFVLTVLIFTLGKKFPRLKEWSVPTAISLFVVLISMAEYSLLPETVTMVVLFVIPSLMFCILEDNKKLRVVYQWIFVVISALLPAIIVSALEESPFAVAYLVWFVIVAISAAVTAFLSKKSERCKEFAFPLDIATLTSSGIYFLVAFVYAVIGEGGAVEAIIASVVATVYSLALMFRPASNSARTYIAVGKVLLLSFIMPLYAGVEAEYCWLILGGVSMLISAFCVVKYKILKRPDRFATPLSVSAMISLNLTLLSTLICYSYIDDGRVIPYALAMILIAAVTYILPIIKKDNRFTGVFPALALVCIVCMLGAKLEDYSRLIYIAGFVLFSVISLVFSRRVWQNTGERKIFDWLFIFSGVLPFMLVFDYDDYITFVGMFELIVYALMYYKRIGKTDFADRMVLSVACAVGVVTYWLQPFFEIPELIFLEINLIPVYLHCFYLWCVWKDRRDKVETLSFFLAIAGVVVLLISAFISGNVVDSLIILFSVFAMLVVSFIIKKRRWFVLSISLIIMITLYMSKDFWESLAWWIYLLGVGVVLILIAAANELGKQKTADGSSKREKLKRFMDEWTW